LKRATSDSWGKEINGKNSLYPRCQVKARQRGGGATLKNHVSRELNTDEDHQRTKKRNERNGIAKTRKTQPSTSHIKKNSGPLVAKARKKIAKAPRC